MGGSRRFSYSLVHFWPPANFKTVERLADDPIGYAIDDERDDALGVIHKSRAEGKFLHRSYSSSLHQRASARLCLSLPHQGEKLRRHHVTKWGWMGAARPALGPEVTRLSLSLSLTRARRKVMYMSEFTITKFTIECVLYV